MTAKKSILVIAAIALLFLVVYCYKLVWGKPFSFNHAVERATLRGLLKDPETLTYLGMIDNTVLDFHSHRLTDASPAYEEKLVTMAKEELALVQSYDPGGLVGQERLTRDIMIRYFGDIIAGGGFAFHSSRIDCPGPYPVNQLFGVQSELPTFMATSHGIKGRKSAENYCARLEAFEKKFDQLIESIAMREKSGVVPPRFVIDKVIAQMEGFISVTPENNILYTSFVEKLAKAEKIDAGEKKELLARATGIIAGKVYPSYRKLIARMKGLRAKADTRDGVWKLPKGDDYYAFLLRFHTTTDMSPEEVHGTGLAEVKRIDAAMRKVLEKTPYRGMAPADAFARMAKDPRFQYPDNDEGKKAILADYSAIIGAMEKGMAGFMTRPSPQPVEVRRIPEFKEAGSPGAYYYPPSLDRTRPGVFYVNLRKVKDSPKFGMRTLAYHEAVPGHHYQIAIAQELKGIPTFRRVYPFTAYVEGWALYAELLAKEYGFQDDPYSDLGRLQAEMFRAVRLVVDTGIHRMRWSREKAIAYMKERTGMPETDVVAEIERYIVMPGQACAYKIGMMKILEMREEARKKLGKTFDIREFHRLVLENGSMPLDLLERLVREHSGEKKG